VNSHEKSSNNRIEFRPTTPENVPATNGGNGKELDKLVKNSPKREDEEVSTNGDSMQEEKTREVNPNGKRLRKQRTPVKTERTYEMRPRRAVHSDEEKKTQLENQNEQQQTKSNRKSNANDQETLVGNAPAQQQESIGSKIFDYSYVGELKHEFNE